MKIVMFGDSITDAGRNFDVDLDLSSYGYGYTSFIAGELMSKDPNEYEIYNRGHSGHRIVDLYARIKKDVWNLEPDVLSVLIGINDVWHELCIGNGVDLERFDRIYRMMIEDTKKRLPNIQFILMEPFVLNAPGTQENYEKLLEIKEYANVIKKIAEDYSCMFVPLQETLDKAAERFGTTKVIADGVHPAIMGAKLIADEWLKVFNENAKL